MTGPFFVPLLRRELEHLRPYDVPPVEVPVKLDANENAFSLSESVRADLARELARVDLNRYPDPRASRLRAIVAEQMQVSENELLFGAGVDEVIGMLAAAFARPRPGQEKARTLFPWPSFVMFRLTSLARGLEPVLVPLDGRFQLTPEPIVRAIREARPNVVFLPTPNNPTGNAFPRETILAAADAATDALVVIDEAYFDFCGVTHLEIARTRPHVAVARTVSKLGLAGLRVGFLVGDAALIAEIDKVRQPYNLPSLSLRAAELCLTRYRDELLANARRVVDARRALLSELEKTAGVEVFPSDANFVLVRVRGASEVWQSLLEQGVLVRNMNGPGPLSDCLRITVGRPDENERLLEALRKALG